MSTTLKFKVGDVIRMRADHSHREYVFNVYMGGFESQIIACQNKNKVGTLNVTGNDFAHHFYELDAKATVELKFDKDLAKLLK